jgi:hypothetical protein
MPTLDDEFLVTVLHELGDSFTLPPGGPSAILGRVNRDDDERAGRRRGFGGIGHGEDGEEVADSGGEPAPAPLPTTRRTIRSTVRSHRILTAAAAVLVLLVVAAAAAVLGNGAPKAKTFGSAAPVTRTPSTTAPRSGFSAVHTPAGTKTAGSTSAGSRSAATPGLAAPATSSAPSTTNGTATNGSSPGTSSQNGAAFGSDAVGQPARIEQTGSLDLTVAKGAVSATVGRLDALAGANDGFVASSQTRSGTSGGAPSGTVTLEVPVASFSAALGGAEALGKVSQLTTNATDVTAQYVDLQSQITALEASRQQYLTIMTRASSIGDVLAVQAQLDSLQSQIQQLQGQLAVLGSETDYSKLTIGVGETATPPHHHRAPAAAPSGLAKAWHDSVHGFVAGTEGLIRIAGPALFALLCLAVVLLGGQLFWRRLQRRNL